MFSISWAAQWSTDVVPPSSLAACYYFGLMTVYCCGVNRVSLKVSRSSTGQQPSRQQAEQIQKPKRLLHFQQVVASGARCSPRARARKCTHTDASKVPRLSLTEKRIGKAVPPAAAVTDQPSASQAGGEAEWRPEHAHQDVAQADVEQDAIDGRPEAAELDEQEEH